MASLLEQVFSQPGSAQALGLLGAGIAAGNFPAGMASAINTMGAQPDIQLKRQMMVEQLKMQQLAEQRAQAQWKMQQDAYAGIGMDGGAGGIGGGISPSGISSPGAFVPSAGGGPVAPISQLQGQPDQGQINAAQLRRLEGMAIAGVPGAAQALEIFKYKNTPINAPGGSWSLNPVTGEKVFNPKMDNGMVPDGQGGAGMMPGYAEAQARQAGLTAGAQQAAQDPYAPLVEMKINGETRMMTPAQARAYVGGQAQQPGQTQPPSPQVPQQPQRNFLNREQFNSNPTVQDWRKTTQTSDGPSYAKLTDLPGITAGVPGGGPGVVTGSVAQERTNKSSSAFADALAAKQAEIIDKSYTAAKTASDDILGAQQARKAMAGGVFMGNSADFKLDVAKFVNANIPGVTVEADKVANTDYLKSTLGRGLLEQAKTLGSNPSNADATRINDIVGSIGKDPSAMQKILDWRIEMAQRVITQHNSKVDQAEKSGYSAPFDLRIKDPLQGVTASTQPAAQPAAPTTAQTNIVNELPKNAPVGTRARDTVNGGFLKFNGLSWVKEK